MIEILVVIAIIIAITAFGLAMSMDSLRRFSFRDDRDAIVAALQKARGQAINNICSGTCDDGKKHGVHFDPLKKEIIIFQGNGYASRAAGADEIIEFKNLTASIAAPAPYDIIFDQLSGNSASSTVAIAAEGGQQAFISVNSSGRIDY